MTQEGDGERGLSVLAAWVWCGCVWPVSHVDTLHGTVKTNTV